MGNWPIFKYSEGELRNNYLNRWWRLQNLYKIRDKEQHLINFRFNNIQRKIISDIVPDLESKKPIRHFDLKYRQGGVSTFWLLFYLDETIFNANTISAVLADKNEHLKKLMKIIRIGWEFMPMRIRPPLKTDTIEKLEFAHNNSEIFGSLSIRSTAIHNLHISEWCFCKDDEIRATLGATSPTTNISGESTGNGMGNDGYETYQDAKNGLNRFKARFSPWFIQDEYRLSLMGMRDNSIMENLKPDEKKLQSIMSSDYGLELKAEQVLWRRDMKRSLKGFFPQEYPETDQDAFLASGNMFFDAAKIQALYEEARRWWDKPGPFAIDKNLDYWVQFYPPEKYHHYAAGADTSEGGNDYSVLKIIDVTDRKEAFIFRGKVNVKKFYDVCDLWCRLYNNSLLGVERNNHGHAVLLGLQEDKHYPNLFDESMFGKTTRLKIDEFPKIKLGWNTNEQNRNVMLDHIKMAVEGDPDDGVDVFEPMFTIHDKNFLSEALTFKQIGGKFQAVSGKFDDDVIASSIAYQMFQIVLKNRRENSENSYFVSGQRESFSTG